MHPINLSKRNRVISQLQNGSTTREVAQNVGVSLGYVSKVRKEVCSQISKSKGGRPRVLSEVDERYCVRKATKDRLDNAVKVAKTLEIDHGIKVSPDTVRRAFKIAGLGSLEKKKKPMLSQKNVRKRLAWCKAHVHWTLDDWKRVIWSDETKINRFNSDGRTWAWIRDGETVKSRHVKPTVKHGGGSIMLWSAITYAGVGWMCRIEGNMDKTLYKEILEDEQKKTVDYTCEKLKLRRDQVIFQHDNDPKHTSNLVKDYLQEQDYQVMDWPPQSPDLNPIENMWQLLKLRLNEYETPTRGMNMLYERSSEIWYNTIKVEEVQKVIESIPNRIKACIKNKGYWTKY
jgi:transposase